jgi:hypothetical protein
VREEALKKRHSNRVKVPKPIAPAAVITPTSTATAPGISPATATASPATATAAVKEETVTATKSSPWGADNSIFNHTEDAAEAAEQKAWLGRFI